MQVTPGGHSTRPHTVEPAAAHVLAMHACPAEQQVLPHTSEGSQQLRAERAGGGARCGRAAQVTKIWQAPAASQGFGPPGVEPPCHCDWTDRQSTRADARGCKRITWSKRARGGGACADTHTPARHVCPGVQQLLPQTRAGLQQPPPGRTPPCSQHAPAGVASSGRGQLQGSNKARRHKARRAALAS